MKIAVYAGETSWNELTNNVEATWLRVNSAAELFASNDADVLFNLTDDILHVTDTDKPYFINSVTTTLTELGGKDNIFRLNGWNGFIENNTWEIAGDINDAAGKALSFLQKKNIRVADEPGLISARIISMIINEAYFAEGEQVSTPDDIDVAMKLGTNYPYGPFEWAEKIGHENIYKLLVKLSSADDRYSVAPLLAKKING